MDVPRGMLVGTLHIFYKHFDQLDKVKFEQRYETNIYLAKIVDTKKKCVATSNQVISFTCRSHSFLNN